MAKVGTQKSGDSIWDQNDTNVTFGKNDKEAQKIFNQMVGTGIVSTETGTKNGGNDRRG